MNNFPAMTEAQRQELAEVARNEIKVWDDGGHYKELLQIALAALTAEPIYQVCYRNSWSDTSRDLYQEQLLVNHHAARIRYAAPPAPVLKPIELPKAIQQHETCKYGLESSDAYGLHWGSKETLSQCIKAIRAAGYEVK